MKVGKVLKFDTSKFGFIIQILAKRSALFHEEERKPRALHFLTRSGSGSELLKYGALNNALSVRVIGVKYPIVVVRPLIKSGSSCGI